MSDLKFKSALTMEEIEDNFKGTDFFTGVMNGLQEALAYTKGQAAADTFSVRSLSDGEIIKT